jgi:hypothetical protein
MCPRIKLQQDLNQNSFGVPPLMKMLIGLIIFVIVVGISAEIRDSEAV